MANYENIRLEKGLYTTGKSFTQTLEELDPSENYKGTSLEGLDAYQRQLKRFDIHVSGRGSDMVEKFFKTTDSAALFPEYISRAVFQGITENNALPKIVATVTEIEGLDYRPIASLPTDEALKLKEVAEGTAIPETSINASSHLVKLKKRGRMLTASYEAIRFQHLDMFTVMLRQIGAYIAKSQFKDAVSVLINGDGEGNDNASAIYSVAKAGTLTYDDLIDFWNTFDPYTLNTIITSPAVCGKLLKMSNFNDAAAGLNFHSTGNMITPFGSELLKSPTGVGSNIIGIDRNCALEQVQSGGVLTEFDKLIDRQLERAAITSICGFSKIYNDATKMLSI